jgi:hypothetical protein
MSSIGAITSEDVDPPNPPAHYAERADTGDVTWIEDAIEDYLGIRVTDAQARICRAVARHKQVLVVTANSLGKSYILAAITLVWLLCRYPAVSFATSGTERKMRRTYCKPVESLHKNARISLPGQYKSRPERIEFDDDPEHFWETASPRDAGELEGVHTAYTLAIIEEADKPDVDGDVIEAMRSLASDDQDRLIAIANPPQDETNSIYPLMDHRKWEVLEFSTFDAHNVRVDVGDVEGPKIDGIADMSKLQDDWEEHHPSTPWPGIEETRRISAPKLDEDGTPVFTNADHLEDNPDFQKDLSKRWYRRRAGIMPPDGASVHRPFGVSLVREAWARGDQVDQPIEALPRPEGSAVDVARSSDRTVLATVYGDIARLGYNQRGTNHLDQGPEIERELEPHPRHPIAVDFIGHGSAIHDQLDESFPDVGKFEAGSTAFQETTYYDKWTEGMALLGEWLADGGIILDAELRKELLAAAREVEYSEKHYASRGEDGAEVLKLSSKDDIKDRLGYSPDLLDAAMMAVWAASDETSFEDEDDGEAFLITS